MQERVTGVCCRNWYDYAARISSIEYDDSCCTSFAVPLKRDRQAIAFAFVQLEKHDLRSFSLATSDGVYGGPQRATLRKPARRRLRGGRAQPPSREAWSDLNG